MEGELRETSCVLAPYLQGCLVVVYGNILKGLFEQQQFVNWAGGTIDMHSNIPKAGMGRGQHA